MKRKSKGQLMREEKLTKREQAAVNDITNDPWFLSLPLPQQIKIVGFIKQKVDEHVRVYEVQGYEKGMIDTMACVVQVLLEDYWKKTGQKRIQSLVADVCSLMDSYMYKAVTWEDMVEYIREKANTNMETNWFGTDTRPTPRELFKIKG